MHHPHLHCVVPGGGLSPDGTRWIACRPGFFLPVRVLSRLFRRLFLRSPAEAFDAGKLQFSRALERVARPRTPSPAHLAPARQAEWVVYAKPPFAGPQQVLDYVGRYTHRVAISNNRLRRHRRRPGPLPLEGLSRRVPDEDDDARGDGIHPPFLAPRAADRLPPHSLLRLARQPPSRQEAGPLSATARDDRNADRQRRHRPPTGPTIATASKSSPASPCAPAPSVTAGRWSRSSSTSGHGRRQRCSTRHDGTADLAVANRDRLHRR